MTIEHTETLALSTKDQYAWTAYKDYPLWELKINTNQYHLGRSMLWLKRYHGPQGFTALSFDEQISLLRHVREWFNAVTALWHMDRDNYSWLCNYEDLHGGHGHYHLVPRYKTSREFLGITFTDEEYGKPYSHDKKLILPQETTVKIAQAIAERL